MKKRGQVKKNWKERWFKLYNNQLTYANDEVLFYSFFNILILSQTFRLICVLQRSEAIDTLIIDDIQTIEIGLPFSSSKKPSQYGFHVNFSKRTLFLICKNLNERNEWIKTLTRAKQYWVVKFPNPFVNNQPN